MRSAERWLPFGLVALLAVLGALQYRWAGALGEAEKERLSAGLRSSLRRFNADVEDELVRVFRFFRVENEEDLGEAYRAWTANEGSSSIIRAVFLKRRHEIWEIQADGSPPTRASLELSFDPRDFPISRSPFALWMPMSNPRELWERRERPSFVVAFLDHDYLSEHVLPEAASRYLSEYDVVVLEEGEMFWSSAGADVNGTLSRPDGSSGFLDLGLLGRGFARGAREPGPRPGPRSRGLERAGRDPRPDQGPGFDRGERRPRLPDFERGRPPEGPFRLLVRHRAGSLQAAVDRARRRNLGLGFGVLSVLAASIVLLSVLVRRARRLSERQMEFVAGVSHELRTPVAVIRSAAQNLADGSVSDPVRVERYGKMLEGEALRLEHLVEEVLELAGIQSNKRQYARERIVARELVEEVARQAASEPNLDGREMVMKVSDEGLTVEGDREALKRALSNLVRNAIKHARDGAVEMALFRRGDRVVFAVSDRGPGVSDEDRAHLFEAFYRGRRARERQVPGSGLGLSLVSHIVREHGGEIAVAAREGGGATFEIRLPESRSFA